VKENILENKKLNKIYHTKYNETKAVEDFSLNVKEGEFLVIVGPSGCGKSTILNILAKLDAATSGIINFNKEVKIGYMLQQDSLFEFRTVLENCLLGLEINNTLTDKNKEYVINLLNAYGLCNFINSYPSTLSGGMRQRVALIRTLALKPDILLLDEAFSALDYQSRLAVSDDVYKIIKKEKKTVIMITHDIAEAISLADRIIVLSKRPSKVKNIYDINLSNKSTPIKNRKAPEFSMYYEKIWKDLDINV